MEHIALVVDVFYYLPTDAPVIDDVSSCFPKTKSNLFKQLSVMTVLTEFQPCIGKFPYAYDEGKYEVVAGDRYQMVLNQPNESNAHKYESPIVQVKFDESISFGCYSMGRREFVWDTFCKEDVKVFRTTNVAVGKVDTLYGTCLATAGGLGSLLAAKFTAPGKPNRFNSSRSLLTHFTAFALVTGISAYVAYHYTDTFNTIERVASEAEKFH